MCEDCGQKPAARGGKCWACIKKFQRNKNELQTQTPSKELRPMQTPQEAGKLPERSETKVPFRAKRVPKDTPGAVNRSVGAREEWVILGAHYVGGTLWTSCANPDCASI